MFAVTGASGQLGQLVIGKLLEKVEAKNIVAVVRNAAKVPEFSAKGIVVREADYTDSTSLEKAFAGVDKLLLISSSEVGSRLTQHANVINAAKKADIDLLVYTSILRADSTPLALAGEHLETETLIKASGIPAAILRNGWYTENYTAGVPVALQHNGLFGAAAEGRIASAARLDYAEAAVAVLTSQNHVGKIYELAGDTSYSLAELAAEISAQTGKAIGYTNLSQTDYKAALLGAGLPEWLAELLSESDAGAAKGALFDDGHQLSKLIGRPTTALSILVKAALESI